MPFTVSVYGLFLYDSRIRDGSWESLDDAVYYVKAVGNTVEFCFAVFLFFNGGWILFFESGGTIRACMIVIHAYFNIWCEAKVGWKIFMKRRTAVAKINSLPFATEQELANHDDVCAICYMDMDQAKITRCKHFFHSVCLRKWLYMQDTCPLCHAVLYKDTKNKDNNVQNNVNENVIQDPEGMEEEGLEESSSEDEDDVLDHDDPPYQAPPPGMMMEQNHSSENEENESLMSGSSATSTRLSSSSLSDLDVDQDEIIFDHETNEEEDLINLMEHESDEQTSTRNSSSSSHGDSSVDR